MCVVINFNKTHIYFSCLNVTLIFVKSNAIVMMFLFIDALHVERIEIKLQAIANPTGRDKLQILEKSDLYNTFICIFLFSVKN